MADPTPDATESPFLETDFLDSVEMTVDRKLRLGIPERFMKALRRICPDQAGVIGLAPTPERSIKLMPYPVFREELDRWRALEHEPGEGRLALTFFTSLAGLYPLDNQNRFRLNPVLMRMCQIQRDVVITGNLRFMQVFDTRLFEELMREALPKVDPALRRLARGEPTPAPIQYVIQPVIGGPGGHRG